MIVGAIGIKIDRARPFIGEIGYFVDRRHWGRGIAPAAVALAERVAFDELDMHRIELVILKQNTASIRVALKCGYRKEGIQRGKIPVGERFEDVYLFAKLRSDPVRINPA